jgi:hypothetical protein
MSDPITIGSLVAAALGAGAAEVGKAVLGQPVRDAYEALRAAASRVIGPAVAQLETKPDSNNRAGVVAELVEEQPEPVQAELRQLAEALRAALASEGRSASIDNRITVIATHGGIAAGRDVNVAAPAPDKAG